MPRKYLIAVGLLAFLLAAAPPPVAPIERWIAELESEDPDVWRRASDDLWHTGHAALPALKGALKHDDPDVKLRAALLIGKLEWGIRPGMPPELVAEIERFRGGDAAQRQEAVEKLARLGVPGFNALRRLMEREPDAALRQKMTTRLQDLTLPAARAMIARGELDEAERLLTPALVGTPDGARHVAAFWLLSGRAALRAREMERDADTSPTAARAAALVRRAMGDLVAARAAAEKAEVNVLAGILGEVEDYKAIVRLGWRPKAESGLGPLYWWAGERAKCDAILAGLKPDDHWGRANLLFETGRIREAIAPLSKVSPEGACEVLATFGRPLEALAVTPLMEPARLISCRLEQAVIAHRAGEAETRDRYLAQASEWINELAAKGGSFDYHLLGWRLQAGQRIGRRDEALTEVGRVLDRPRGPFILFGNALWMGASNEDAEALTRWWEYLQSRPGAVPSETMRRLDGWFVAGKADEGFDATLKAARAWQPTSPPHRPKWPLALARACERVGRFDQAEEVLREQARDSNEATAHLRLGEFYFARKRWAGAAEAFAAALKADPTQPVPTYLRGVALVRAGDEAAGKELIARARLLPLADEEKRYTLARALERAGLNDEAAAEWLVLARTGVFGGVYPANAHGALGRHFDRQGKYTESARSYRLMVTVVSLGDAGSFTEMGAYLRLPGYAHHNEARAHLAAGRIDEAVAAGRRAWYYLPEQTDLVIDLVRGLEKAGRTADADRLIDERLALMQRLCVQTPRSAGRHNGAAWVAARSGRRLDVALRHAKAAVELAPTAAGYFDTLAEVRFQRGEQAEALKAIDQAIRLAPKDAYFAAQRKRIEAGDVKADVPKR